MKTKTRKNISYLLPPIMALYALAPNCLLSGAFTHSRIHALTLSANPFRYSGYYQDFESKMDYLKARYYSPKIARFISQDTYDLSNRYAYCDGNPVSNIDPFGHTSESANEKTSFFSFMETVLAFAPVGAGANALTFAGLEVSRQRAEGEEFDWKQILIPLLIGFVAAPVAGVCMMHKHWVKKAPTTSLELTATVPAQPEAELTAVVNQIRAVTGNATWMPWASPGAVTLADVQNLFKAGRILYHDACEHLAVLCFWHLKGRSITFNECVYLMRHGTETVSNGILCRSFLSSEIWIHLKKEEFRDFVNARGLDISTYFNSMPDNSKALVFSHDHVACVIKANAHSFEFGWNDSEHILLTPLSGRLIEAFYMMA